MTDYLKMITDDIETAYETANGKLIGSEWDLSTANLVCEALQSARWLAHEVKRLQGELAKHDNTFAELQQAGDK